MHNCRALARFQRVLLTRLLCKYQTLRVTSHPDDTHLLTKTEAAAIIGVDTSTLSRWITQGKITPAKKIPGQTGGYIFTRAEVARVAALHTPAASP